MPTDVTPAARLPQLAGRPTVTDGGMETDLIFHRGVDLPHFAAFPLLEDDAGRGHLADYYDGYAEVAARAGAALLLEAPTWRANPDWGARLGYSTPRLARVNRNAIAFLQALRDTYRGRHPGLADTVVSGMVGPRGDGYRPGADVDAAEAEEYHREQITAFAEAGADLIAAYTLTDPGEAIGVVRAARRVGLPVAVSFTVETDGRLAGGTTLRRAIDRVDAAAPPDHYLLNCAHPTHLAAGLLAEREHDRGEHNEDEGHAAPDGWRRRILGLRYNASRSSHAELDAAEELDDGDPEELRAGHDRLLQAMPWLTVIGGCCGTDVRHVARLWS